MEMQQLALEALSVADESIKDYLTQTFIETTYNHNQRMINSLDDIIMALHAD